MSKTKYISKNGLIGEVKEFDDIKKLEVRNKSGKVTQKIPLSDINLSKFKKV